MIGLTDTQLKIMMHAARTMPVEKRDMFLQRIAAMLALRGRGRFTDTDVADVAHLALCWICSTNRRQRGVKAERADSNSRFASPTRFHCCNHSARPQHKIVTLIFQTSRDK